MATNPKALEKFYRQSRTFQIFNHLPLWVQLKTDFANNYPASVIHGKKASLAANRTRRKAEGGLARGHTTDGHEVDGQEADRKTVTK